eukprot:8397-Eustigmatos_ZCMA.PRE.1
MGGDQTRRANRALYTGQAIQSSDTTWQRHAGTGAAETVYADTRRIRGHGRQSSVRREAVAPRTKAVRRW